jgi:hypothetical protein
MSTLITAACWPLQGMSPAQKSVLISLADQANDDGVCWPSVGTLSMRTCLSERAVQGALRWLVEAGFLRVSERTGRSTVYRVTPANPAPPQQTHPRTPRTPADSAPTPADAAPPPPQQMHPTPADAAPRTVKEPSIEPSGNRKPRGKRAAGFDAAGIELPEWLDAEDWQAWVQHRRELRKPLTELSVRQQLLDLDKARQDGVAPGEVIRRSVAAGWTGLWAPRAATASDRPQSTAERRSTWTQNLRDSLGEKPARREIDMGVLDATGRAI